MFYRLVLVIDSHKVNQSIVGEMTVQKLSNNATKHQAVSGILLCKRERKPGFIERISLIFEIRDIVFGFYNDMNIK